jgi:hypothetical protein
LISGFEALLLGPAEIHAHEHFGPVLGFGAAGAGVDGDDGVEGIGFSGEHGAGLELFGVVAEGGDFAFEVGFEGGVGLAGGFAFAGELEVGVDVAGSASEFGVKGELLFDALAVAHEGLRELGVGPEGRVGEFLFYGREFGAEACGVKDTPAGRVPGRARGRRRIRDQKACNRPVFFFYFTGIWHPGARVRQAG